jgi:hypothetical protein
MTPDRKLKQAKKEGAEDFKAALWATSSAIKAITKGVVEDDRSPQVRVAYLDGWLEEAALAAPSIAEAAYTANYQVVDGTPEDLRPRVRGRAEGLAKDSGLNRKAVIAFAEVEISKRFLELS